MGSGCAFPSSPLPRSGSGKREARSAAARQRERAGSRPLARLYPFSGTHSAGERFTKRDFCMWVRKRDVQKFPIPVAEALACPRKSGSAKWIKSSLETAACESICDVPHRRVCETARSSGGQERHLRRVAARGKRTRRTSGERPPKSSRRQ